MPNKYIWKMWNDTAKIKEHKNKIKAKHEIKHAKQVSMSQFFVCQTCECLGEGGLLFLC